MDAFIRDGEQNNFPLGSALGSRAEKEPTNSGSLGSAPLDFENTIIYSA